MSLRREVQGYGLSVVYRGKDRFQQEDIGLFVSQVIIMFNLKTVLKVVFILIRLYQGDLQ